MIDIPVIDIAPFRDGSDPDAVARAWDDAMRRFGFAQISGHGIGEALIQRLYDQAQDFFAQPLDRKMTLVFADLSRGQGYGPMLNETVGRAHDPAARPDLCESLSFTATPGERANLWPDLPGFRAAVDDYMRAANALVRALMRLSARALALPEDFFDPFYARMTSDLRLVLYPDQISPPQEGQLRYGPHTDFGGFTLLRQDDAPGGLEVLVDGTWVGVKPVPGTFVVNAGDLIQRWTNDVWKSNVHRVVNPSFNAPLRRQLDRLRRPIAADTSPSRAAHEGEEVQSTQRLSMVLFTGPDNDAMIQTLPGLGAPRHPPIRAGQHVGQRIAQTYGNLAR